MATKPKSATQGEGGEQILFVKSSEREQERVLGSFPLDADPILIDAAKIQEINRARSAGLDVHALQFRVAREQIQE